MPRVHYVKRAAKPHPECGVEVGEAYFWWKHKLQRGGLWRCSRRRPRPSQLTLSEFWQAVRGLQEDIEDSVNDSIDDLEAMRDHWAELAREIGEEQSSKLDGMPDGLQEGNTGQLLQERADACEAWVDEIEAVGIPDPDDFEDEDEYATAVSEAILEMAGLGPECG